MIKINLVPEVQEKKRSIKRVNSTATTVASILVIGVVIVNVVLYTFYNIRQAELKKVESDITGLNQEISNYKELEETVVSLEKGLTAAKTIFDTENKWTKLLNHLENATPGDSAFTSLKLNESSIEAKIESSNIESLARFIQSYKDYKVIALRGTEQPGKSYRVTIDGKEYARGTTKSTGAWVSAIPLNDFSPEENHEIKVEFEQDQVPENNTPSETEAQTETNGDEVAETATNESEDAQEQSTKILVVKYTAETKNFTTDVQGLTANITELFSNVHTSEYKRESGLIKFDVKMNFNEGLIW